MLITLNGLVKGDLELYKEKTVSNDNNDVLSNVFRNALKFLMQIYTGANHFITIYNR